MRSPSPWPCAKRVWSQTFWTAWLPTRDCRWTGPRSTPRSPIVAPSPVLLVIRSIRWSPPSPSWWPSTPRPPSTPRARSSSAVLDVKPPPDVFAAVMATGIVSIAAADHGYRWLSMGLAVLAVVGLPVLMVLSARSVGNVFTISDPDVLVRLFSYVAACAVLGARFAWSHVALWVFFGLALQGWLALAP